MLCIFENTCLKVVDLPLFFNVVIFVLSAALDHCSPEGISYHILLGLNPLKNFGILGSNNHIGTQCPSAND